MAYTYEYPRPSVTADCVVITKEDTPQVCYKGLVHDITLSGMSLTAEELQEPKKDILKTIEL
jgi:hypothetical protein